MDVAKKTQDQRLERNCQALRITGSGLADRLRRLGPDEQIELIDCASGAKTARVRCEDGAEVLIASRRDPVVEARRWVDSLDGIDADRHAVAVTGFGLGYHVAELLRRRKGGMVIVLEPSLAMVHAALRCHDFARDIVQRRLVLVVARQRSDLFEPLMPHNTSVLLGTKLTQHPASARVCPAACTELQRLFTEYLHFARSVMTTALEISATTCDNILKNLPYYVGWPDVSELADCWKGRPAICVAAGPSLRKNMHLLARAKGTAAIIAVQTVLRPLLAEGIRPDFVTALDYSPLSRRFYEGLPELPDVTLIADPKVNPIVPNGYPGPIRMFYNHFASRVLAEFGEELTPLQAGSTVAHLNLYLARHLGADPVVLIGQDLGYGENIYYAPGSTLHTAWAPELNRFNTLEMMEWQRIVRSRHTLRKVPGQGGREIYTDAQMFTYIQQFERDIAEADFTVINATEGGASLAGAEEMPLAEVLARYADAEPASLPAPPDRLPDAAERAARAAACVRRRRAELEQMAEICQNVLGPLKEMQGALDDPPRFNKLHAKMDAWRVKIDSLKEIYRMVADATQLAELKRFQMDNALLRKEMDEIDERRDQLDRDIQYVTLIQQGVEFLDKSMREALERLEAVQ